MRTQSLAEILDKSDAPETIDFLSLDVEGAESRILLSFPFEKYRFRIMMIKRVRPELQSYLLQMGYTRAGSLGQDVVYLHNADHANSSSSSFQLV